LFDNRIDNRRRVLNFVGKVASFIAIDPIVQTALPSFASAESGAYDSSNKFAPDFVQSYSDFTTSSDGFKFRDVKIGTGDVKINNGDRLVFDWSGYTIGYFGRPFEAKGYV
jgi:hypothetical protein